MNKNRVKKRYYIKISLKKQKKEKNQEDNKSEKENI